MIFLTIVFVSWVLFLIVSEMEITRVVRFIYTHNQFIHYETDQKDQKRFSFESH